MGGLRRAYRSLNIVAKADRFIENPSADRGRRRHPREEATLIKSETKKIGELLGVA